MALAFAAPGHGAEAGRELGRVKVKPLEEASGLAASRLNANVVWIHNDGEAKHVFAVKTTGKVAAQVKVPETVEDVEDIAIGPGPQEGVDYVYLADIGDNDGNRREVRVIRFIEPTLDSGSSQPKAQGAEVIRLKYPDGPHDAEAFMLEAMTGDLLIATKEASRARVYVANAASLRDGNREPVELALLAELGVEQISGGDASRDGRRLVLRSEDQGWLWDRLPGESLADVLRRQPQAIAVRGRKQGNNGESIGFAPSGRSYYTISEGKDQRIYEFDVPEPPNSPIR